MSIFLAHVYMNGNASVARFKSVHINNHRKGTINTSRVHFPEGHQIVSRVLSFFGLLLFCWLRSPSVEFSFPLLPPSPEIKLESRKYAFFNDFAILYWILNLKNNHFEGDRKGIFRDSSSELYFYLDYFIIQTASAFG